MPNTQAESVQASCNMHGPYEATLQYLAGHEFKSPCPSCAEERAARLQQREAEWREEQRRHRIEQNRQACSLPARFANCSFDGYLVETPQQHKVLATVRAFAERFGEMQLSGANLTLCGKPGTGKTHLAAALGNALLDRGHTVRYHHVYGLLRELKDTWSRDAELSEAKVMRRYCQADLLLLDEVGVQFGTDTERTLLFEVIDGRYADRKPTVVVSNLDRAGLEGFLGERVLDRLLEKGSGVLVFDWPSYRRRKD